MTISTKARQAKIDALNVVVNLIYKELGGPSDFVDLDGNLLHENPLYKEALTRIMDRLENERDDAALKLYRIENLKALKEGK